MMSEITIIENYNLSEYSAKLLISHSWYWGRQLKVVKAKKMSYHIYTNESSQYCLSHVNIFNISIAVSNIFKHVIETLNSLGVNAKVSNEIYFDIVTYSLQNAIFTASGRLIPDYPEEKGYLSFGSHLLHIKSFANTLIHVSDIGKFIEFKEDSNY